MHGPIIRKEIMADREVISELIAESFGAPDEALLVADLHNDGHAVLGLVAEIEDVIVGYILFSRVVIETFDGPVIAASLAPLAVTPSFQKRGIGTALTEAGLRTLAEMGEKIVFVLGEPDYYRCFDFSSEDARAFTSPWSEEAGDAHMVLALQPGALSGLAGEVQYGRAFDRFVDAGGE